MILTDEEREALFNDSDLECYSSDDIEAACKFAAAVERKVLRKLRERPADAWLDCFGEPYRERSEIDDDASATPVHIIPEEHE